MVPLAMAPSQESDGWSSCSSSTLSESSVTVCVCVCVCGCVWVCGEEGGEETEHKLKWVEVIMRNVVGC